MDDNEKFVAKWKIIHDETMGNYVIPDAFVNLVILIAITIIILWIYPSFSNFSTPTVGTENVDAFIMSNAFVFVIATVARVLRWFSGERRFKKIINKE